MPPPPLSELLARKEEEWRALRDSQAQLQEAALQDAQAQLQEARGQLQALREDFEYNLGLLEERDRELERCEAAWAQARTLEEARQAELSELRVRVARLQGALAGEAQRSEALQRQQRQTWQQHQLDLQRLHSARSGELAQRRQQCEDLRRRLESRLRELDGDLARQRQELLQEFEAELRRREAEADRQARSLSSEALARELQVDALTRELAAQKEARARAVEAARGTEGARAALEQELQDLAAAKDARIRDLEAQLRALLLARTGEQEALRSKHEKLDRLARERDAALAAAKGAQAEQLQALEAGARELQARCEGLEEQLRGAAARQADTAREKDALIERLREDALALKSGWDAQVAQLSREMVSKDLQAQALREEAASLHAQLARTQQDVARYGQQLALAAGREQQLQRDKAQLELGWQRRCDGIARDLHRRAEDLVQALGAARGQKLTPTSQAAAKLEEAERRLREQEAALTAVAQERDQALQALRTPRPLPGDGEAQAFPGPPSGDAGAGAPPSEVQRLQEQNASLRVAVAQMRREMEALSGQAPPPAEAPAGSAATPDSTQALGAELRNLQRRFKALEEQVGDTLGPLKTSSPAAGTPAHAPASPAATGAAEPAGGTRVGQALRRLGDRARLLSWLVVRLQQQVRQEPLDLGAMRRELPHGVDQVQLEVSELREQVAELEKHLGAARRGGGGAPCRPAPHTAHGGAPGGEGPLWAPAPAPSAPRLQRKLKEASREILRLRREKEQLLELGNRLRAALGRPAGSPPRPTRPAAAPDSAPHQGRPPPAAQGAPDAGGQDSADSAGGSLPYVATTAGSGSDRVGRPGAAGQGPHTRPEDRGPHTRSSPSLASSGLQDTWKLLDLGSSPSGLTSQEDLAPERKEPPAADPPQLPHGSATCTGAAFAVTGTKVAAQARARPARTSRARPARPQCGQRPPRIRNYNLKD